MAYHFLVEVDEKGKVMGPVFVSALYNHGVIVLFQDNIDARMDFIERRALQLIDERHHVALASVEVSSFEEAEHEIKNAFPRVENVSPGDAVLNAIFVRGEAIPISQEGELIGGYEDSDGLHVSIEGHNFIVNDNYIKIDES